MLYGPGEAGKREEALKLRRHFSPDAVSIVDLKNDDVDRLESMLISPSLFSSGQRLVVAENASEKLDLLKLPVVGEETTTLILSGNLKKDSPLLLSAQKLSAFSRTFEDKEEITAFPFLDNLLDGKTDAFTELDKLLKEYGPMYILAMIYYSLRRNFLPLPTPPFMQKKITRQKSRYHPEDWLRLYRETIQADFALKSGTASEKLILSRLVQSFLQWT